MRLPKIIFCDLPIAFPRGISGKIEKPKMREVAVFIGRGSWIRTNDLQYPKLPRYQAALYPETIRK
jgi:hypothetical protein